MKTSFLTKLLTPDTPSATPDPDIDVPSLSKKQAIIMDLLMGKREMYGLEMVHECADLKRGTIYVTLQRMEDKEYVVSRVEESPVPGPPRRLYALTGLGQRTYFAWQAARTAFAEAPA